jgi:hypothetical protein
VTVRRDTNQAKRYHPAMLLRGRVGLSFGIGAILILTVVTPALAQKKSKTLASQVAEQKRQLEEQLIQLEEQKALADSQSVRIRELEEEIKTLRFRLEDVERQMGAVVSDSLLEARLKGIEATAKKSPELPPDIVSAGDFPGSIRIPGSDAAVKFGGRVRTAVVLTLDPLGTDDRFLTNSIPVGDVVSGEDRRTNISARASRLNVEFRTPIGKQEVRAFFEGDFAGAGNAFRLRHAYAQFLGLIVGQTWSTFSDPWTNVEDLDFEGISSENLTRQPQIRYWWNAGSETRIAFAMETPEVSITGGSGVNLMPDLVGRVFKGFGETGHVQVAGLLRQVRGEATPGDVRSDWGWGLSASGVFPFHIHELEDRIIFQVNGGYGIARYVNDLGSLGLDAVFDTTSGDLKSLPALGWYVAYEHSWKQWKSVENMNLRSTFLWSFVDVGNFDFQPPDAYNKTHRFAVNLVFSPAERVDVGVEYINGSRENKNGERGTANQIQTVMLIRF